MSDNTYNGWTSWNVWNVGLWLGNDEGLYRMVQRQSRRHAGTLANWELDSAAAAGAIVQELNELGLVATPDGAVYNVPSVLEYLESDWEDTFSDVYAEAEAEAKADAGRWEEYQKI